MDSSTAGDGFSSAADVLGSSPSQDRSVDFLHSTNLVLSQARLPTYTYYSKMDFTYKPDRTTVTVGAPSKLAISTSPASAGTSSAWVATGSPVPVVAEASDLLSSANACGSTVIAICCATCGTVSSTVKAGLRLLSVIPPTVSQSSPPPSSAGLDDGISCDNSKFNCQHAMLQDKYPTTLLEELTSWEVDSVTFSFLATGFRATWRDLLGGIGRLASKLVGGSTKKGIWGTPGRLNLDRS
jgi:hypothetical protein